MNLTQIIEKAEGEFDGVLPIKTFHPVKGEATFDVTMEVRQTLKSFLSEKMHQAYKAGWNDKGGLVKEALIKDGLIKS